MLIWLIAVALAGPVQGRVTLGRLPIVDAQVAVLDASGSRLSILAYTDSNGGFSIDVDDGNTLRVTRSVRTEDGGRTVLVAQDIALDEARRIDLQWMDVGGGVTRLSGRRSDDVASVLKSVRKQYSEVQSACERILTLDDRDLARQTATELAPSLSIGFGTGFEGCAMRHFAQATTIQVAQQLTYNLDTASGPGGQPLWAGLASVSYAQWCLDNNESEFARRAAGAAVTRLAGITSARAGTPVAEAARPLLAQAYETEAEAALQQTDAQGAVAKFHQALRVFTQLGNVGGMARSQLGIARSELARGRLDAAQEHLMLAGGLPLPGSHRVLFDQVQDTLAQPAAQEEPSSSAPVQTSDGTAE